jgi:hypothetical protein
MDSEKIVNFLNIHYCSVYKTSDLADLQSTDIKVLICFGERRTAEVIGYFNELGMDHYTKNLSKDEAINHVQIEKILDLMSYYLNHENRILLYGGEHSLARYFSVLYIIREYYNQESSMNKKVRAFVTRIKKPTDIRISSSVLEYLSKLGLPDQMDDKLHATIQKYETDWRIKSEEYNKKKKVERGNSV